MVPLTELEQLARLRVATVSGHLPRDLGAWAIEVIESAQPRTSLRHVWVPLLRSAACQLDGGKKARARELQSIIAEFRKYPGLVAVAYYCPGTPLQLVQASLRIEPCLPTSERQLMRIL